MPAARGTNGSLRFSHEFLPMMPPQEHGPQAAHLHCFEASQQTPYDN